MFVRFELAPIICKVSHQKAPPSTSEQTRASIGKNKAVTNAAFDNPDEAFDFARRGVGGLLDLDDDDDVGYSMVEKCEWKWSDAELEPRG